MKTATTEVVIVGAGPTGLMAALLLHRCGVRVRLLDRSAAPAHESRAFVLQARSLELLQSLGLIDEFLKRGTLAPGLQLIVEGRLAATLELDDLGRADTPYPFLFMLPQSEIESLLIAALAREGVRAEYGLEVLGFESDAEGVRVEARTAAGEARRLKAAYLIGADGAHSVVRKTLGLSFEGGAYAQTFVLADCAIDWPFDYEHVKLFFSGRALGLYLPLKGRALGRVMAIQPRDFALDNAAEREATHREALTLDEVQAAFAAAAGAPVRLSDAVWTARYRIHHRGVNAYFRGRVFVAGDAAHIHSPAGGQGMNTGLQDAANLAWKLAEVLRGRAPPALLETYQSERWPVGQKLLAYTDRLFSAVSSRNPLVTALRNRLLPALMRGLTAHAGARARAFHFISQLGIRYRDNPFLRDDLSPAYLARPPTRLRAGHRAPNALIARHRDVFGLIAGYRFHVLALSKKPLNPDEIAAVHAELRTLPEDFAVTHFITRSLAGFDDRIVLAESSEVFENYGLSSEFPQSLLLVRPDGYIAYRSDHLSVSRLKEFLLEWHWRPRRPPPSPQRTAEFKEPPPAP